MKKIFLLALTAVLILSACGQTNLPPQTVTFRLDANPGTGFSWQVEQSKELFEVRTEYTDDEQAASLIGAGGTQTVTLIPLKPGKCIVTLSYTRPWEGGEEGDQLVYAFEIDRYRQVKMTDAYSLGTDEPVATPMPMIG